MKDFLKVLDSEANAILKAKENIDRLEVEKIIGELLNMKGKLIVKGLGKGGHIGKKLAASFSSMGTTSFFVHAAELFHGDFGMIEKDDVVLLISHRGSTKEVVYAAEKLRLDGNKLIALTASKESKLSLICDYKLNYGWFVEADHLNMAPSNTSTIMLAVGDALMISVSIKKGYTKSDFKTNHPGGSLGAK